MKILIVDDSKAMRLIVMRALRQAGFGDHALIEASNGIEALALIKRAAPDLILADWNMPQMSGIELLRSLTAAGLRVSFGFITSEVSDAARQIALEAGALFVVTKPFTAEIIRANLAAFAA